MDKNDTPVAFVETSAKPVAVTQTFKVLIVDDDEDVHLTTPMVLASFYTGEIKPAFLHARSAAQAYDLLSGNRDVAVVLLDVVMETDTAGLRLVEAIRNDLGLATTQIVLRTGQPGIAAEEKVVMDYAINGYLNKADLTPVRLFSAITLAHRAFLTYEKERAVDRALTQLLPNASAKPYQRTLETYTLDCMAHMAALMETPCQGLAFRRSAQAEPLRVVAVTEEFVPLNGLTLDAIKDASIKEQVNRCISTGKTQVTEAAVVLPLKGPFYPVGAIYLRRTPTSTPYDDRLMALLVNSYLTGVAPLV